MKKYIFTIISAVSVWSCVPQVDHKTPPKIPVDYDSKELSNFLFTEIKKDVTFQQVKINSKINADLGKFVPTIDGTIYIEKGKKVWLNMSALLFNVARGIATPEGVKGYEKINKTHIDSDFSYLNQLLNVNFINYNALQNLLIGKTFIPIDEKNYTITKTSQGYNLQTSKNQKITVNGKTTEYKIFMEYSFDFQLNKVLLQEIGSKNQLEIFYSDWAVFGKQYFPQSVKIIIKGEKNGQILIENTKFDFSTMPTPYSVPSGYTKVDIK